MMLFKQMKQFLYIFNVRHSINSKNRNLLQVVVGNICVDKLDGIMEGEIEKKPNERRD